MDLTRRKKKVVVVPGSDLDLYPHDLQLYLLPPLQTISLAEFETLAVDRLKALRIIENVGYKGLKTMEDIRNATIAEMVKEGLKYFAKLLQGSGMGTSEAEVQARRKDHISHFILRLAYCRSEELRRWFLKQEVEFFRIRFLSLSPEGIKCLLKVNNMNYNPISSSEKQEIKDLLFESTPIISHMQVEMTDFYKVPFIEVLNIVGKRKCYVSNGFAYIPSTDLFSVVASVFKTNLSGALARTSRLLPCLGEDERLGSMLKRLHTSFTGKETYLTAKAEVSIANLNNLSKVSYPPCMRQLHESIRANHHSRHGGRQQYGLFLKGIGVTLQDALQFWRDEFTQKMDYDQFEKKYAYNVRHNYGKEGRQLSYTPYSCLKIIMSGVGTGDSHGCPFRHNDVTVLRQQLTNWNIPLTGISDVLKYAAEGHYQLACGKYFELTHGGATPDRGGINHPNQYFEDSQKILNPKKFSDKTNAPGNVGKLSTPVPESNSKQPKEDMWDQFDDSNWESLDIDKNFS